MRTLYVIMHKLYLIIALAVIFFLFSINTEISSAGATNSLPIALDDYVEIDEDSWANINVLVNDTDADGDFLNVSFVSGRLQGYYSIDPMQSFTYTPRLDYFGMDEFVYSISDGFASSTATVNIKINAVNDVPVTLNADYSLEKNSSLTFNMSASDVEFDALTYYVINNTIYGNLTYNETTGLAIYIPESSFTGEDFLIFQASDGLSNSSEAIISFNVTETQEPEQNQDSGGGGGRGSRGSSGSGIFAQTNTSTNSTINGNETDFKTQGDGILFSVENKTLLDELSKKENSGISRITGAFAGAVEGAEAKIVIIFIVVIILISIYLKFKKGK